MIRCFIIVLLTSCCNCSCSQARKWANPPISSQRQGRTADRLQVLLLGKPHVVARDLAIVHIDPRVEAGKQSLTAIEAVNSAIGSLSTTWFHQPGSFVVIPFEKPLSFSRCFFLWRVLSSPIARLRSIMPVCRMSPKVPTQYQIVFFLLISRYF